jgi:hypothetical protein
MEPILGGCVQGGGIGPRWPLLVVLRAVIPLWDTHLQDVADRVLGPAAARSAENAEERNSRTVAGQGMAHSGG